jgi:hypothetical protein
MDFIGLNEDEDPVQLEKMNGSSLKIRRMGGNPRAKIELKQ